MSLDEDFAPYFNGNFITPDGNPSGNQLRYTSEYYIERFIRPEGTYAFDRARFELTIRGCQVKPGLLRRRPDSAELQSLDDYVAVASAASLLCPEIAADMLTWGDSHWGSFNNPEPDKWTGVCCLYRFPAFRPHLKYSARERPGILGRLAWAVSVYWNGFAKHPQDPWVLSWHLIHSYENSGNRSWDLDLVVAGWKKKFRKRWPGGMKECLTAYYTFEHPLAKYWPVV